MEDNERLAWLFQRYHEKTCTRQEKEELFQLLQSTAHDETLRNLIDTYWDADHPLYHQDKAAADLILRRILRRGKQQTRIRRIVAYTRVAAILFAVSLLCYRLFHLHKDSHPVAVIQSAAPRPAPHTDSCLTLPDGSKVLLHEHSTVEYPASFARTRPVILHGEAYFDIRPDPRPFIVHSGVVRTTVLGTAFNINARNINKIVITVTKGKVKVENGAGQYSILRHDQQLSIDSLHQGRAIPVDAAEAIAWKKNDLLFNDVTMKEAMDELARRYHTQILFANPSAANCRVTASFTGGESFEAVLMILTKINNLDYVIDQAAVTISGEGCK